MKPYGNAPVGRRLLIGFAWSVLCIIILTVYVSIQINNVNADFSKTVNSINSQNIDSSTLSALQNAVNNSNGAAQTAALTAFAIAAILGLTVIIVGVRLSRTMTASLNAMKEQADKAARGDFSDSFATNSRDEFGQLSNSFAGVIDSYKAVADAANRLYSKRDGGDSTAALEADKFQGEFRELAQTINGICTLASSQIADTTDVVERYAAGDFSAKPKVHKGKPSGLSMAFDKLGGNLTFVSSEAKKLAAAAAAGDLSARIDGGTLAGGWKTLVASLNGVPEGVSAPVREVISVVRDMSEGNLNTVVSGDYKGDCAELKELTNTTVHMLSNYVSEISAILSAVSRKDLTSEIKLDYIGDFASIKDSIGLILKSFNDIMASISESAEHVASGARYISESSMMLAQGATEQSLSVDELTLTLDAINSQTSKNAQNAEAASRLALSAKENADVGNEEMNQMLDAMNEINEASRNISKIIKVIEEIALQTNLLALNAAVEAAHAGRHGKGFTVVADQVRNLAGRSKQAAQQSTALIQGTLEKVSHGTKIADQTAEMLKTIVDQITDITELVGGVATASNVQAEAISKVNTGIAQISSVTQANSAASEEEASSSQELSSQAEVFRSVISGFKLKGGRSLHISKPTPSVHEYHDEKPVKQPAKPVPQPIKTPEPVPQPPKVTPTASPKPATPKATPTISPKPETPKAAPTASPKPATPKAAPTASPKPATPKATPTASPKPATPKAAPTASSKPAMPKATLATNSAPVKAPATPKAAVKKTADSTPPFNSYDKKDFGKY